MLIRVVAVLGGGFLILYTSVLGYRMTQIVPGYETPESTRSALITRGVLFLIWYGGVLLGVLFAWQRARKKGRVMTALEVFKAGLMGIFTLIAILVIGLGLYGLIQKGSFMEGIGNVGPALAIVFLIFGLLPASGTALLVYGMRKIPVLVMAILMLASVHPAEAQQSKKVLRGEGVDTGAHFYQEYPARTGREEAGRR